MGVIDVLASPITTLLTDVVDRIFPDKDKQAQQRAELLMKAQELDNQLAQGQMAINQAEAANSNLFVAGWRPFIGWCCGVAFAYKFVIQPLAIFLLIALHADFDPKLLPILNWEEMSPVLMGILGLGVLRTGEKLADKGHLPWQK